MRTIVHWTENFFPVSGGGPAHVYNIASNIQDFEHVIITRHINGEPHQQDFEEGFSVIRLPKKPVTAFSKLGRNRVTKYVEGLAFELQTISSKLKYMRREGFELLHFHGVPAFPRIWKLDRTLKLNSHTKLMDFSSIQKPKLLTLHNLLPAFTNDPVVVRAYNHYVSQFDNIICVDRHIYDYCINLATYGHKDRESKSIWLIHNSIDTNRFSFEPLHPTKWLKLGFVGRLARTVDIEMINQLIAKLPPGVEFHLAISGAKELINVPHQMHHRVKICEDVPQAEMPVFYHGTDVLFNPILHEGVSRVTLEAMACGRPVIMYNNSTELPLVQGETGYLIERDIQKVLELLSFLVKNQNKLEDAGSNARKVIEKEWANNVIFPRLQNIYERLLAGEV